MYIKQKMHMCRVCNRCEDSISLTNRTRKLRAQNFNLRVIVVFLNVFNFYAYDSVRFFFALTRVTDVSNLSVANKVFVSFLRKLNTYA